MNRMTVSAKGDSTRPVENDGRQFDGCGKCLVWKRRRGACTAWEAR
jgi:hypothetical protein